MFKFATTLSQTALLLIPITMLLAILAGAMPADWRDLVTLRPSAPFAIQNASTVPLILNTLIITLSATLFSSVFALALAIAQQSLHDGSLSATASRFIIETLASIPRILWGMAGAIFFCILSGLGISSLAGILTLTWILIPILTTGFIDSLSQTKNLYLPTCQALGMPQHTIWIMVILPASTPSLIIAIQVAMGKAMGDAAALYLTAGLSTRYFQGLDAPASTLAVHIFTLLLELGGSDHQAFAHALVLICLTTLCQTSLHVFAKRKG